MLFAHKKRKNQLMFRFKTTHLFLLLGLIAPVSSFASEHYGIAVNGGFGGGGTTSIGIGFACFRNKQEASKSSS
jgi:hypothetical protein